MAEEDNFVEHKKQAVVSLFSKMISISNKIQWQEIYENEKETFSNFPAVWMQAADDSELSRCAI